MNLPSNTAISDNHLHNSRTYKEREHHLSLEHINDIHEIFQCAIYGKNFCVSAKNAFMLIMRNIVRYVMGTLLVNASWSNQTELMWDRDGDQDWYNAEV